MTNQTLSEWVKSQDDGGRAFAQERLIVAITEQICDLMVDQGVTKSELAVGLKKSKAYVSQLLHGTRNMTLRTLADVAYVLGRNVTVRFNDRSEIHRWQTIPNVVALQRRPSVRGTMEAHWTLDKQWVDSVGSNSPTESKAA